MYIPEIAVWSTLRTHTFELPEKYEHDITSSSATFSSAIQSSRTTSALTPHTVSVNEVWNSAFLQKRQTFGSRACINGSTRYQKAKTYTSNPSRRPHQRLTKQLHQRTPTFSNAVETSTIIAILDRVLHYASIKKVQLYFDVCFVSYIYLLYLECI